MLSKQAEVHIISSVGGIHLSGLPQVRHSPRVRGPGAIQARWMAPLRGRPGLGLLRLRVDDQVAVAHWVVTDRQLEQSVEVPMSVIGTDDI